MGNVGKLDKLTRSFLTDTSNPFLPFDPFKDLQDPTYMSFKIDFFPHLGESMLDDSYSSGGLFRVPSTDFISFLRGSESAKNTLYYRDSAYEYLYNIGSPTRQAYHRAFASMLYRVQQEAPWYFQSITGLGDLYKIDPAMNFRGKDKVLTIDCLETIDMRMSYLAELYRNMAFDSYNMREILPVNLRTFNMMIHVLEFRRFNTTFGIISDALATPTRSLEKEEMQKLGLGKNNRNVYKTSLGAGLFDNFTGLGNQVLGVFGGIGGLFGGGSGLQIQEIESAFEAISVHTFFLKDCEFDFFSEAPPYYDTVSVADNTTPATFKFKIKVGRIEKIGRYPFHNFVIAEHIQNTMFSKSYVEDLQVPMAYTYKLSEPYHEKYEPDDLPEEQMKAVFRDFREAIFPTYTGYSPSKADSQAYKEYQRECDRLRRKPLERLLGGILRNATNLINDTLNEKLGELTGGLIGDRPLGNVYGRPALIDRLRTGLSNFFSPGEEYEPSEQTGNGSQSLPKQSILPKPKQPAPFVQQNILPDPPEPTPFVPEDIIPNPPKPLGHTPKDILPDPPPPKPWVPKNVFDAPPSGQSTD